MPQATRPTPHTPDVLVIGAGPAGLAATAELARAGVSVACLAPEHPPRWPNNYGIWVDELAGPRLGDCAEHVWAEPAVWTGPRSRHSLARPYARLDNEALRGRLIERAETGGVVWLEGIAASVDHDATGATVTTRAGQTHRAALVVDATGHSPRFVERQSPDDPGWQVAYGVVAGLSGSPVGDAQMALMDYRDDYLAEGDVAPEVPTFLYAMDLGGGRWFVEETVLVSRPRADLPWLERRLQRRLARRGVRVELIEEVERCLIPMGTALPRLEQRVVGFGGAASMVHPATGYMIAGVLRAAPRLAAAIAGELGAAGGEPAAAARRAWRSIWPEDAVRARTYWRFGMEALLSMDAQRTRGFFDAFFSLPEPAWRAYMGGTLAADEVPGVMWSLFRQARLDVRTSLVRSAISGDGLDVFSEMVRGWR